MRNVLITLAVLSSTGCVVVGGYSPEGGWFIWPGTFVLLGIALVVFLLFRRRT
ncbi:MAG TPA: hypothetical protein VK893_03190 [Pyrinomonadaceae bacterium]|nr:hypothetical protein [Pyrinomonadaceae bacterium]